MKTHRIVILPSLFTLANAVCGFAAITFTTRAFIAGVTTIGLRDIVIAGCFIFLAMVVDAIDGRLARFARATSDFGGQLDSLCDVISFGVAPAFLMHRCVVESLQPVGWLNVLILRTAWICAVIYVGCAVIRLARFNVENVHDEEAHMHFRGLPTPPAAGFLTALVFVLATFWSRDIHQLAGHVMLSALPAVGAILGVLMVSRIRYIHLINHLVRGRRPIDHLVRIVLALAAVGLVLIISLPVSVISLAIGFAVYVLSGPVQAVYRTLRGKQPAVEEVVESAENDANDV